MTRVWMYVLAASADCDGVDCHVPWRVDEGLIFFGPCKKRMRERLRKQYLKGTGSYAAVKDDIHIVGVNAANSRRLRKVVWWGKLSEVMTFAEADRRLRGERFRKLRDHSHSPLHVRPIEEDGAVAGYEHVSNEHRKDDSWIGDLVSEKCRQHVQQDGRQLFPRAGYGLRVFDRDCCMLLENRFFAAGAGIAFDGEGLQILRNAQPRRTGIDEYAIFGLKESGSADGRRGGFLELEGDVADRCVQWLGQKAREETGRSGS